MGGDDDVAIEFGIVLLLFWHLRVEPDYVGLLFIELADLIHHELYPRFQDIHVVNEIAHEKDPVACTQLLIPGMNRVKRPVDGLIELIFLQLIVHEPISVEPVSGETSLDFENGRMGVEPDDDALRVLNGVNLGFRRADNRCGAKHLVVELLLLG